MRRILAVALLGAVTLAGLGCAAKASYVKKTPDGGEIVVKAGGTQEDAVKLIEKHIGSNYQIVDTRMDPNVQQTAYDPMKPGQNTGSGDMHYVYTKATKITGTGPLVNGLPVAPNGGNPSTGMPANGMNGNGMPSAFGPSGMGAQGNNLQGMPAGGGSGFGSMGNGAGAPGTMGTGAGMGKPPAMYPGGQ